MMNIHNEKCCGSSKLHNEFTGRSTKEQNPHQVKCCRSSKVLIPINRTKHQGNITHIELKCCRSSKIPLTKKIQNPSNQKRKTLVVSTNIFLWASTTRLVVHKDGSCGFFPSWFEIPLVSSKCNANGHQSLHTQEWQDQSLWLLQLLVYS